MLIFFFLPSRTPETQPILLSPSRQSPRAVKELHVRLTDCSHLASGLVLSIDANVKKHFPSDIGSLALLTGASKTSVLILESGLISRMVMLHLKLFPSATISAALANPVKQLSNSVIRNVSVFAMIPSRRLISRTDPISPICRRPHYPMLAGDHACSCHDGQIFLIESNNQPPTVIDDSCDAKTNQSKPSLDQKPSAPL
jgi:hypothetical protein